MDFSRPRPISPGASLSAKDVAMLSSISWEAELVPERPRTAELRQRRPSITESICGEPNPTGLPSDIWRILHSHYVAFSIDTAAIANMCEEPAKREALMQLRPKRYVGLVVWSGMQPEYAHGAGEDDPPLRHAEVLAPLFVAGGPPPIPRAKHMCLPIDPSPPVRKHGMAHGSSITEADGDTTVTMDGIFEMDDEFQRRDNDDPNSQMDEDAVYDPYQDPTSFGPLTAIRHPTLLPLKGRCQWLTFGTRVQITTLHDSSLSFYLDDGEDQPPYEWRRLEALVTEHLTALNDACPPPDAGSDGTPDSMAALLERLRVPDHPIPAVVWRDIRGEHEDDPTEFVRELDR